MSLKQKALASSLHFLASLLVIGIFIFILLRYWYPAPYFTASGGWQGLKLVIFVDLALGPLLTFIIFNKTKPLREKLFDFSLIIGIQLAALIWGINTVYHQRPVAIVFWDDRFYTVPDKALSTHYETNPQYQSLVKQSPPPLIFASKPINMNEHQQMMQRIQQHDIAPHHQIELYQPFEPAFSSIKQLSLDIIKIIDQNKTMRGELDIILEESNTSLKDNTYLPLESRYRSFILVFNSSGKQLGYLKAPPKIYK